MVVEPRWEDRLLTLLRWIHRWTRLETRPVSVALASDLAKDEHGASFVIEKWDAAKKRWRVRATRGALEEAEAYAWTRLTRAGGEYRVRQGRLVLARGAGYANRWSPTERTAVWGRVGDLELAASGEGGQGPGA